MTKLVTVAFDPGDDTGWAWSEVEEDELLDGGLRGGLGPRSSATWDVGQFVWKRCAPGMGRVRWENRVVDKMVDLARETLVDSGAGEDDVFVVLLENFRLRLLTQDDSLLSPVRLTAAFQYAMRNSGVHVYTGISPSDAKNTITNERLLRWGLLPSEVSVTGEARHGIDAERVMCLHLRKYAADRRYRAMFPPGRKYVSNTA